MAREDFILLHAEAFTFFSLVKMVKGFQLLFSCLLCCWGTNGYMQLWSRKHLFLLFHLMILLSKYVWSFIAWGNPNNFRAHRDGTDNNWMWVSVFVDFTGTYRPKDVPKHVCVLGVAIGKIKEAYRNTERLYHFPSVAIKEKKKKDTCNIHLRGSFFKES